MLFAILYIILQCFFFSLNGMFWGFLHSIKVCLSCLTATVYSQVCTIHSIIDSILKFFTVYKQEAKKHLGTCLLVCVGFPYNSVADFVLMIHIASCPSYPCHASQQAKHIPCPIIGFGHVVSTTSEGKLCWG